jgi:hypothetical protein
MTTPIAQPHLNLTAFTVRSTMDYIAAPRYPPLPPLAVPHLVKSIHEFSGEAFLEFPGLKHLVCDQRHDGIRNMYTMEGVSFPESCSFVQS